LDYRSPRERSWTVPAEGSVSHRSALRAEKRVSLDCGNAAPAAAVDCARQPNSGQFPSPLATAPSHRWKHRAYRVDIRCMDVLVCTAALVLFAPLIPILTLTGRLDSPGPAFFVGTCLSLRDLKEMTKRLAADLTANTTAFHIHSTIVVGVGQSLH